MSPQSFFPVPCCSSLNQLANFPIRTESSDDMDGVVRPVLLLLLALPRYPAESVAVEVEEDWWRSLIV